MSTDRSPAGHADLTEEERHAIGHARYQVAQASPDKPECSFDYELVRDLLRVIDKQAAIIARQSQPGTGDSPERKALALAGERLARLTQPVSISEETRTVRDPFLGRDVKISDRLVDRLRGKYAVGPTMANGEPEFGWRRHEVPPIQKEAADLIERLLTELRSRTDTRDWQTIIQGKLDGLAQLPCRTDEMTEREGKMLSILSDCVGFLQYMRNHVGTPRDAKEPH